MNKDYKRSKNELKSYYSQDVDDNTITEDFDNLFKWNDDVNGVINTIIPYSTSDNLTAEKVIYELERLIGLFDDLNEINAKVSRIFKRDYFKTLDDIEFHVNLLYNQKELKKFIDENESTAKKYFKSWNNVKTDFSKMVSEYEGISKYVKEDNSNNIIIDSFSKDELKVIIDDLEDKYGEIAEDYKDLNSLLNFKNKLSQKNINSIKLEDFYDIIQSIAENIRSLSDWSQFNTYCSQFKNNYTREIIKLVKEDKVKADAIVPLFEFNFANNILIEVFDKHEILKNFNSNIYEKNIQLFKELDVQTIDLNKYRVKEILDNQRPDLSISIPPTSQLGILVHEMNKKRNHKSIRQILNECNDIITDIKPCFLMSPLSIAQYLDTKTFESYFDYIIFDEASQVKIEDAIGALLRGKHYIIMGDTKQLPPTAFFDVETNIESQEAEDMHVQDVESILHFCKTVLPYRMLKCHYRSRHESLIAVSNLEFYNNDLFIYPSPIINSDNLGLKLIYNPNNIYDKGKTRQNKGEAKEVVEYALRHFGKYGYQKSLGIGTFSVAQKQAILEELELRLKENPELDPYFNTTGDKAFFVKNIENIQGDERDVMLISIGYGFDETHNLSSNFGPLNNDGGERRLNVLTTRAKEQCIVFANFKSSDMHLTPRSPKGVQVLKTYLYYAEYGRFPSNVMEEQKFDSDFEKSVYNFLIKKGYKVEKRVGCSGYRVDLAVLDPNDNDEYILAIECDGTEYNDDASARERDRIRQNMLEGLGWNYHRIWSTEWYHNRLNAKQNLIRAINDAIKNKEQSIKTLDDINNDTIVVDKVKEDKVKSNPIENVNASIADNVSEDSPDTKTPEKAVGDKTSFDEFDEIFEFLDEEDSDAPNIIDYKEIKSQNDSDSDDDFEVMEEVKIDEELSIEPAVHENKKEEQTRKQSKSVMDKVKSKVQIKKVEVDQPSTEKEYDYYENDIDCDDFYSLNDSDVIEVIEDIIRTEAPIHREEIYNRLKNVYGVKATKKFKLAIDSMISKLLQHSHEIYVKNNFYYIFKRDIVVRKRIKPNIDYISDDEIIEAITQVLILNNSVKIDQLAKLVSKLFGFKSLSAKTANKLNEVISFLRFSDKLEIDSSSIVTLKDTN